MNIWIGILLFGLACSLIGFVIFFMNPSILKTKKPALLVGILLPLFLAYSYGDSLVSDSSYNLTLIDLSGLLGLGIISGIYIGCYFLVQKS